MSAAYPQSNAGDFISYWPARFGFLSLFVFSLLSEQRQTAAHINTNFAIVTAKVLSPTKRRPGVHCSRDDNIGNRIYACRKCDKEAPV